MKHSVILETRDISKRFQNILANDGVNFCLRAGEIHAVLGENGAGKSTLMNIICGLYAPDAGSIYIEGEKVEIRTSRKALEMGIGMVHQHFMLLPNLTVSENIMLGVEPTHRGFIDQSGAKRRIRALSEEFGLAVDPETVIDQLPVGGQQRVEIIKTLYRGAKILVLDEPTAVLTPREVEQLFLAVREGEVDRLVGQGDAGERFAAMSHFRGRGAEEFTPHGRVVKNVADFDGRTDRAPARGDILEPASDHLQLRTGLGVPGPASQRQLAHLGDRRQRFAAEAERIDPKQIVGRANLARRMGRQRQRQLLGRHPAPVVHHPHQFRTAAL